MKIRLLFVVLFCCLYKISPAQEFTYFSKFNTAVTKFPGDNVRSIHRNKNGSLFTLTDAGIATCTNNVWKSITEFEGYPLNAGPYYETDNGSITLLLSGAGSIPIVTKYNYITNILERDTAHPISKYIDLSILSCIETDSAGDFWVGSSYSGIDVIGKKGLIAKYSYDFFNNTSPLETNEITTIYRDYKNNMWIGTYDKGLYKYDGKTWVQYKTAFEQEQYSPRVIKQVIVTDAGIVWVATDDGVFSFDGTTWKKFEPVTQNVTGTFIVNAICIDSDQTIWCGGDYGLYSLKNGTWDAKPFPDMVVNTYTYSKINSILIDNNNTKLIGTDFGIVEYTDTFSKRTVTDGYDGDNAFAVQIDKDDNIWIGNVRGLSKYDGTHWINYNRNQGLVDQVYQFAIDSKNRNWSVGQYGFTEFNDTVGKSSFPIRPIGVPNEIKIDSKDHVWIGADSGLYYYDLNTWTFYNTSNGLPANRVRSLGIDKSDAVWIGTDNGIAHLSGTSWYYHNFGTAPYSNVVKNICIDNNNNVWCSTPMGLYFYNGTVWKLYSSMGDINDIKVDADNVVWICTQTTGIYKFDGEVWQNISNLLNNGFSISANELVIDKSGNKWVALDGNKFLKLSDNGAGSADTKNKVYGYVFNDLNNNKIKDAGEEGISNQIVQLGSRNFIATDTNGRFVTYATVGLNEFIYKAPAHWLFSTDTVVSFTYNDGDVVDTSYFGIYHDPSYSDLAVNVIASRSRTGFETYYWLNYYSMNIAKDSFTIKLELDSLADIESINPVPASVDDHTIIWKLASAEPFEKGQFYIKALMPDFNFAGDTLYTFASIYNNRNESTDTLRQILTNSFDPNDKQVREGTGIENEVLFGTPLKYTIRFQNTGTDTAYTVVIKDFIDSGLDVATLKIAGSSHPVKLNIYGKNQVNFIFDHINLLYQSFNDSASIGFVSFTINPVSAKMQEGTNVTNAAQIYFDFNPPIYTNTVSNKYVSAYPSISTTPVVTAIQNQISEKNTILIYPNPTYDNFVVTFSDAAERSMMVIDVVGNTILEQKITDSTSVITLLQTKPAGMYQLIIYDKEHQIINRSKIIKL